MTDKIVIPLARIRDVAKGSCWGKGSTEKMGLFGVKFLNYSSRNISCKLL